MQPFHPPGSIDTFFDDDDEHVTPDGTPYTPPRHFVEQSAGSNDAPSAGRIAVAMVVFFAAIIVALIAIAAGSGLGSEACLPLFGLTIFIGIIAVLKVLSAEPEPPELHLDYSPPEPVREVVRMETIHETVKVRCRYCGTLNEVTRTNCLSCGGTL